MPASVHHEVVPGGDHQHARQGRVHGAVAGRGHEPAEEHGPGRGAAVQGHDDEPAPRDGGRGPEQAHQDGDGTGGTHRVQTRTAVWGLPHAWLAVFDPEEPVRRLVDGETVAYRRTPVTAAVERAGHAAAVLARHAEDSELLGELAVMIPWLQAFHPASVLELDYGGLTPHVWPDDSAFDLWTLLDALEEGDEATAGLAQERLNRRWGRVGMLAHAN